MVRLSLRLFVLGVLALVLGTPAFGYTVVNTTSNVTCLFTTSSPCSVTVTDYSSPVLGSGFVQSRVFQGQPGSTAAGKWVYLYRIDLRQVAGIGFIPYVDQLAIYNAGPLLQYDFNFNGVATDQVYNVTVGGLGTKAVTTAWLSGGYSYFDLSNPVYGGSFPGDGESSYFFGFVSDYAPVVRTIWVRRDSISGGWLAVNGYAPNAP